jgi:DNA-binding transcriptional LysR family regulator
MDARDLKVFESVARLGGMGRAAAELATVQSNVTARIRDLEAELGAALFERHARGVRLTAAGERLLPYARRIAALLDEARRAALDDGSPSGRLVLGALETTTATRLSPALNRFVAMYPEVDLTLRTGTTAELLARVGAGEVEGAFVCGPVAHPELEATTAFEEMLVLLTAPSCDSLEALLRDATEPRLVVLRQGCSYRQRLEGFLVSRGVPAPRVMEFGTLEAILGCVAAGLGITLLPHSLLGEGWRSGRLRAHALPGGQGRVETLFVRRKDAYVSSALRAFLDLVAQQARPVQRLAG